MLEASLCALRSADLTPERGCQTGASPLSRVLPGNAEWLRAQSADTANSVAYLRCPSSGPRTVLEDAELMASLWLRYGLACPNGHKSRDPAPRLDPTGDYRLWCRTFAGFRSARPGPARRPGQGAFGGRAQSGPWDCCRLERGARRWSEDTPCP